MDDIRSLPRELNNGNTEYKLQLINLSEKRIEELRTQMRYRMNEGSGEAVYKIGVKDDGKMIGISVEKMEESIENLKIIAGSMLSLTEIERLTLKNGNVIAYFLVREDASKYQYIDLNIAVAGNVDSGKSTTIGVLTGGRLDDGRGRARTSIAKHPHERETGRTSYISHAYMGYDNNGNCLNDGIPSRKTSYADVVKKSSKIITFSDMAGHRKYLSTTIAGFSSAEADYAIVIVGLNRSITDLTIEHIGLCICFRIPFMILITKVDSKGKRHLVQETLSHIKKLLRNLGVSKVPIVVKKNTPMLDLADKLKDDIIVPILRISNVTGLNIGRLKKFINLLPKRSHTFHTDVNDEDPLFTIKEAFTVTGVGTVVSGFVLRGKYSVGQKIRIGPMKSGEYMESSIRSIHDKRMPTSECTSGQWICFAVKNIEKKHIRKGMVIILESGDKRSVSRFTAEVSVIRGNYITIRKGYEPVLNMNNIAQSARIVDMGEETVLRANNNMDVCFKFVHTPCHVNIGDRFVFREGKVCGSGIIKEIDI